MFFVILIIGIIIVVIIKAIRSEKKDAKAGNGFPQFTYTSQAEASADAHPHLFEITYSIVDKSMDSLFPPRKETQKDGTVLIEEAEMLLRSIDPNQRWKSLITFWPDETNQIWAKKYRSSSQVLGEADYLMQNFHLNNVGGLTLYVPLNDILSEGVKEDLAKELERISSSERKEPGWQLGHDGIIRHENVVWLSLVVAEELINHNSVTFNYSMGIGQEYATQEKYEDDNQIHVSTGIENCKLFSESWTKFSDKVSLSAYYNYEESVLPQKVRDLISHPRLQSLADKAVESLLEEGRKARNDYDKYGEYLKKMFKFI